LQGIIADRVSVGLVIEDMEGRINVRG
jgi:hypothetical protein